MDDPKGSAQKMESSMHQVIQVGTILIEQRPVMAEALGLQTAPYSANWGVLNKMRGLRSLAIPA
jgi:hypothetical protein